MTTPQETQWRGVVCGLGAAALFGLSAPLAKLLLAATSPLVLAGLFYVGAGVGLTAVSLVTRGRSWRREAQLRRSDAPYLVGILALGGIAGPVLMLYGLARVSGIAGSLLLNLEGPFTVLVAVTLFKEHIGPRVTAAVSLVVLGAVTLGYGPGELRVDWLGILAIGGACMSWALDNNWTQRLSLRDPIAVVRIKTLGAGACSLALAFASGERLPPMTTLAPALLVGVVCYGVSVVLDVYALRLLGAAREAALFATAPFVGAIAALPLLGERPGVTHALAALLMGCGAVLLVRERHSHMHTHEVIEHDHSHLHDAHHQHEHEQGEFVVEPHTHPHVHARLVHDHRHVPDPHHRHRH